jgi:carbon-monoxide dehydrogenase small subunit
MDKIMTLRMTVNGQPVDLQVPVAATLASVLRENLGLIGTKIGCEEGECGACTVLVDGVAVNSCLYLAMKANGRQIRTIEGLAKDGQLHPLQQAFIDQGAVQCGYCTPGMLLSAVALLEHNPHPTDDEIRRAISGNLCRCTGYIKIIDAIRAVADGH